MVKVCASGVENSLCRNLHSNTIYIYRIFAGNCLHMGHLKSHPAGHTETQNLTYVQPHLPALFHWLT